MATSKKKTASTKEEIEKLQVDHEHYKKFDVFLARIRKEEVWNVLAEKNTTIIKGWQLVELAQPQPSFIEPDLVFTHPTGFNWFIANESEYHKIYLPQGQYEIGNILSYEAYAELMGIDKKKDKNILLAN
jgi:hypothetical protein